MATATYYKLEIQGIVYLVDPATAVAYTYDPASPVRVGNVIWTDPKTPPRLEIRADWPAVEAAKLAGQPTPP